MEIRRRLIEANAPQKGGTVPRRIAWNRNMIQHILGAAKEYTFGLKTQSRGGEEFTISVDPILDMAMYEAFLRVRETNINYPARHLKREYLIGGLLYCACNRKWGRVANHRDGAIETANGWIGRHRRDITAGKFMRNTYLQIAPVKLDALKRIMKFGERFATQSISRKFY